MMKQNKSSMAKSSCPYSNKLNSALHPTNWSWILLCHLAVGSSYATWPYLEPFPYFPMSYLASL